MPGVKLAADHPRRQQAQYLQMTAKDAVLGEASEEKTAAGAVAQFFVGLTGLDTAQDARDITVSAYKVSQDPSNTGKWKTLAIYAGFALIPFVAGAPFARVGREAGEAAEEAAEPTARFVAGSDGAV